VNLMCRLTALLGISLILHGCSSLINVTTSEPLQVNPGKRSVGARIDDSRIQTIAEVNLKKAHAGIPNGNVHVNTFNGVVLLTGQVANDEIRQIAGETVNKINPVRQVHNEIEVRPNAVVTEKSYDTWLTTKVKGQLLARGDIEGRRVKVVSEGKTVFLMGLVSRDESERITEITRTTRGVGKVVRVFEYID